MKQNSFEQQLNSPKPIIRLASENPEMWKTIVDKALERLRGSNKMSALLENPQVRRGAESAISSEITNVLENPDVIRKINVAIYSWSNAIEPDEVNDSSRGIEKVAVEISEIVLDYLNSSAPHSSQTEHQGKMEESSQLQ